MMLTSPSPVPAFWRSFCRGYLHLAPHLTACWWEALQQARWSRAVGVRREVESPVPLDEQQLQHLMRDILTPRAAVALVSELQRVGDLGRGDQLGPPAANTDKFTVRDVAKIITLWPR
jgi:hypothetical protein